MDVRKKDGSIEILRGWAIIGVLLAHTSMYFKYSKYVDILVLTNIVVDVIAHFAVPLFLFISGFVLTLNHPATFKYRQFYKKRFGSVLPQYILISCLYLLCFNTYKLDINSVISIVKYIITFDASFHLWFFKIILEFYLFYPIVRKIYNYCALRSQCKIFLLLAVVLQLIWTVGDSVTSKSILLQILLFGTTFLGWIIYFALGIITYSYRGILEQLVSKNVFKMLTTMLIILIPISAAWIDLFFGDKNYMLSLGRMFLEPILYVLVIMSLFAMSNTLHKSKSMFRKLLLYIGDYSFGIYLIHVFFIRIFVDLVAPTLHIGMSSGWFYIGLFLFMTVLSVITVDIVCRLPFHELFIGRINSKRLTT